MRTEPQLQSMTGTITRAFFAMLLVWGVISTQAASGKPIPDTSLPAVGVFFEGEAVTITVPGELAGKATRWQVLDDRDVQVASGDIDPQNSQIDAGALGIGWYRVEFLNSDGACVAWTTRAVLARLSAPIPEDSPICVDTATAWFARDNLEDQDRFSHLAALAGMNWTRDRMKWNDIQPEPDRFESDTTYDSSAEIQARYGLQVLQVFHDTPGWAVTEGETRGRFPTDLRFAYQFGKAMAERFKGRVQAWEPWNEGNIPNFGGHTTDEMCTFQKAAYLGFKAGDPNVIVCWNVSTASPTLLETQTVLENETWSYFDTYNIHTYDWPDSYARLWKPIYAAAAGRPIWITESDRGMKYEGPEPWCEMPRKGELQKAEFMAQSYASSLGAGVDRHFHFILGNYHETSNGVQFGLLREDMTPRPAYVALAAIGRLLAGARCMGQWSIEGQPDAHVYAFQAKPDGKECDVIVAWAEQPGDWDKRGNVIIDWQLPAEMKVQAVYDHLGRSLGDTVPEQLKSAPVFVLLEPKATEQLPLIAPPRCEYRPGKPCPVVLQLSMPRSTSTKIQELKWSCEYEHQIKAGEQTELPLSVYNFSKNPLRGTVAIEHLPEGWTLTPRSWNLTLGSMARAQLKATVVIPEQQPAEPADCWIRLRGDFGNNCKPILAFRLITQPGQGYPKADN